MHKIKSKIHGIFYEMQLSRPFLGNRSIIMSFLFILYLMNVRHAVANVAEITGIVAEVSTGYYDNQFLSNAQKCRLEKAPLDRLDCYDNAWQDQNEFQVNTVIPTGEIWQRAQDNETSRKDDSLTFIVNDVGTEIDRKVVITTPALGSQPPRPIFMLSCKDNITRMQIILMKPIKGSDLNVKVTADNQENVFKWFIRENGYVIESSRGLDGIAEISALFEATKIQISADNNSFSPLTFLIRDLKQTIKPLREACHW